MTAWHGEETNQALASYRTHASCPCLTPRTLQMKAMTNPPHRIGAILTALSLLTTGCGLMDRRGTPDGHDAPSPASRPGGSIRLEVAAPRALERLLETHLDLARLAALPPSTPISDAEIERLVAQTPSQAQMLLHTQGYFNAAVSVARVGGSPPIVRVTVREGSQATVGRVRLEVQGQAAAPPASEARHARRAKNAFHASWPLRSGDPFTNGAWSDAKVSALLELRGWGYRQAEWEQTLADVDANQNTVDLSASAVSGPLYRTGELRIEGLKHQDEQTVRNLANFAPGTPATDALLLDFQERLQTSGLFDGASVMLADDAPDAQRAPVRVRLTERKLQEVTAGLGIGADVGPRVTLEHTHRRAFHRALTGRNELELSGVRQMWNGELRTHARPGLHRYLIGGTFERVESHTDVETSARARVGRSLDTNRMDRLLFAEVERSLVRSEGASEESYALSAHLHLIRRRVDNLRLPTRGYIAGIQVGGGQASSDPGGSGPFARGYARLIGYRPLGGQWHSQGRVEVGQVFARDDVLPPASMRFRAGGQDSVRGYEYRALAPTVNGVVTGGKVLFTASAELAHPLMEKYPDLWGAVFVDAGRAAQSWPDLRPAVGVGAGVRYRSPIGPVNVDLAWGQETKRLRLHVSVGVTF